MEDVHHFDIQMTLAGDGTTVLMDGRPLTGVRRVCVEVAIDKVSKVTLEVIGTASLSGDAKVWVLDRTQEMTDKIKRAEDRADAADIRAMEAEDRSSSDEVTSIVIPVSGVTVETPVKDVVIKAKNQEKNGNGGSP